MSKTEKGAKQNAPTKPSEASAQVPATQQSNMPAMAAEFGDYAGMGAEKVTARDLLIPRITILQQMSPQVNPKKAEFIEGAEIGQIIDVALGQIFGSELHFLPVVYRKEWLEWAPRSSGKGLVAIHQDASILDQTQRNDRNQPVLPNGNLIAETAQFFGLNLTAKGTMCFLPLASTQLKKAKKWMTLATGERLQRPDGSEFQPPLWYRAYKLTTVEESNNDGDWTGWRIERDLPIPEYCAAHGLSWPNIKERALKFAQDVASGAVRGDVGQEDEEPAAAGNSDNAKM